MRQAALLYLGIRLNKDMDLLCHVMSKKAEVGCSARCVEIMKWNLKRTRCETQLYATYSSSQ